MAKRTLTDRLLKSLKPAPAGKRPIIFDSVVRGFGVRSTDKGKHVFVLVVKFPGGKHPVPRAIGEYGAVTLEAARNTAREWLEQITKGIDPAREAERR